MSFQLPLRTMVAGAALLAAAQAGFGQAKIAVVNVQAAMAGTAEYKKASAQAQATFKPRADELDKLKQELDALAVQLQSGKLTDAQAVEAQNLYKRKQTDAQRKSDDLQQDSQAYEQDVFSKMGKKMSDVVKKLAEEKGYDVVLEASASIYVKTALDITNEAIAAYDKAYPAAAAPPAGK